MRVALFMLMTLSLLLGWAAPGNAAQFIVLIDSDTNTGTGCQSNIPAAIDGIEFRIIATVADTPNPATVESVTLERCQASVFESPSVIGGGQPLGVDNGVGGSDVIEFALGEALIQSALTSGSALIHFGSTGPGGTGAVLSASYSYTATGSTAAIPSLSDSAVIALALALAVLGWRTKGRAAHFGITLILVCTSGGLLIGAQFSADGNIDDWMGALPLAQHPGGGGPTNGHDIIATFTAQEAGRVFFRLDVRDITRPPLGITPAAFPLAEHSPAGTAVGNVPVTGAGSAALTFSITAGNGAGGFNIDPSSGQLTVADPAALDFETTQSFSLTIQVSDDQTPPATASGTITINLADVNEAPSITTSALSVAENSSTGTAVGLIAISDPDAGQSHSFSITGGNTNNTFAIATATGQITVANSAQLTSGASFSLAISVTDSGSPALSDSATVSINVTDVNDPPVVTNASFSLDEHSAAGTAVGTVVANDQDLPSQTLSYAITAGNTGSAFAIDTASGAITVATPAALDFETTPSFALTVTVTDNGSPALSATGTVSVSLNDINDAPVVQTASFTLDERSANGTSVGTVAATDADLPAQTLSFAITAGNTGSAFTIDASTGALTVATSSALDHATTPSFTLTVTATDNGTPARSGTAAITVTLNDINDPPAPSGGPFAVAENSPGGTVVGTIAANDPDSGQSHSFTITGGDGATAFDIDSSSGQITVSGNVALNFESKTSYSLTVQATDSGSPALTAGTTVTINLTDVNEAPSIADASLSIAENSANGTVVGSVPATDPDAGQSHSYTILSGNTNGAYAIGAGGQITVANSAALDYENAGMRSLTLGIQVTDNGTPALTDTAAVTVSLTNVNEAPSPTAKSFDAHTNLPISVPAGSGLLVGATDPDGGTLSVGTISASTPAGAVITAATDGSFTFTPPPGVTGPVSFDYQVCDTASLCGSATVTITVAGPAVWFVDGTAAAGGTGTQSAPFKNLASAGAVAGPDSRIFVAGPGNYTDGIILPATSRLVGQGASGSFDTVLGLGTLPTHAVARPTLGGATPTIGAVNIGSSAGVLIRGVAISTGSVTALSANGATSLDIAETSVTAASATAVSLTGTSGNVQLSSTISTGGTNNVSLSNVSGSIILGAGSLSGATGAAFSVASSGATITYAGSITNNTQGVTLTNNTGTIAFSGPLALSTAANTAFTATGGGTVQATHTDSTLSTTTATALNITGTTIGGGDLVFRRIDSSSGATPGIVLSNTGVLGGLSVLGNGSAGSGGTIQGKAASCISVSNSRDLQLAWMVLQNCQTHGLDASELTNFSLTNSTVSTNGDAGGERGLNFNGLYGTATIAGTTVTGSASDNLRVENSSGTLTQLNITGPGCVFSNTLGANGNDGILIVGDGTATMSVAVSNCSFTDHHGDHFQTTTSASNTAVINASFTGNTLSHSSGSVGAGVTIANAGGASTTANVSGNTITGAVVSAITIYQNGTAGTALNAILDGNTIGSSGVPYSGSAQGDGITVTLNGNGTLTTRVSNNNIKQYANAHGIQFVSGDGNGMFNGTLTGNTVSEPYGLLAMNGFHLNAGLVATDTGNICLNLIGNQMAGAGGNGFDDFRLRQRQGTTVRLPEYGGASTDTAAVISYVQAGRITGSGSASAYAGSGGGFTNTMGGSACPLP